MTDVYSAPPMPSETVPPAAKPAEQAKTAEQTRTGDRARTAQRAKPAKTPKSAKSAPPPTTATPPPASSLAESAPPTYAYPRPAGAVPEAPAPKPSGPAVAKPSRSTTKFGVPRPKASVRRTATRQAHLTIARIEPWSVMKFSFVISLIAFIVLLVAVMVLYALLSALGVFDSLQHLVSNVTSSQNSNGVNAKTWFSASRIFTYTVILGVVNLVLITALSTIGSVVYNLTSRLIGGVEVTLKESD